MLHMVDVLLSDEAASDLDALYAADLEIAECAEDLLDALGQPARIRHRDYTGGAMISTRDVAGQDRYVWAIWRHARGSKPATVEVIRLGAEVLPPR